MMISHPDVSEARESVKEKDEVEIVFDVTNAEFNFNNDFLKFLILFSYNQFVVNNQCIVSLAHFMAGSYDAINSALVHWIFVDIHNWVDERRMIQCITFWSVFQGLNL